MPGSFALRQLGISAAAAFALALSACGGGGPAAELAAAPASEGGGSPPVERRLSVVPGGGSASPSAAAWHVFGEAGTGPNGAALVTAGDLAGISTTSLIYAAVGGGEWLAVLQRPRLWGEPAYPRPLAVGRLDGEGRKGVDDGARRA